MRRWVATTRDGLTSSRFFLLAYAGHSPTVEVATATTEADWKARANIVCKDGAKGFRRTTYSTTQEAAIDLLLSAVERAAAEKRSAIDAAFAAKAKRGAK